MNERQEQFNDQGYGQAFRGQGSSPTYGFSNSYQPSPQAQAFGAVLEALQDPRNQWMGTGLAGLPPAIGKALSMGIPMTNRIFKHAQLQPSKEVAETFVDRMTGTMHSGDNIMSKGKDPWLGYDRSFAPKDMTMDYMPDGVNRLDKAARYMEAYDKKAFRDSSDLQGKVEGGSIPPNGARHADANYKVNDDPVSWAKLLDSRWSNFNRMKQEGTQAGMSEQETMLRLRQMNLLPPGYNETKRLGFNPGQN